jgi:hypothetical protein
MTAQLVLQFKADGTLHSFDKLIGFEQALASVVGQIAVVDGHDCGSDEMNIFIITEDPIAVFNLVHQTDESIWPSEDMKAAYRLTGCESYVCLWPPGLNQFRVA